jgi:hypothetical protein
MYSSSFLVNSSISEAIEIPFEKALEHNLKYKVVKEYPIVMHPITILKSTYQS